MMSSIVWPAVVTVGDEVVYGERRNSNQEWLAATLYNRGFPARVTLSLGDDVFVIANWIRYLRDTAHTPILIAGGLGGTHDDQTRAAVARAYDVPLVRHPECYDILLARYRQEMNPERERMAWLPQGCTLLANPLGAPGFSIGETYAFPGFPKMLMPMATDVFDRLFANAIAPQWIVDDFVLPVREGDIARDIEAFAAQLSQGRIGIYPNADLSHVELTIRLRTTPEEASVRAQIEAWIATKQQSLCK